MVFLLISIDNRRRASVKKMIDDEAEEEDENNRSSDDVGQHENAEYEMYVFGSNITLQELTDIFSSSEISPRATR